jgi:16S rRNA processing protein RimM
MDIGAYFKIGYIMKPHGLKGEVTVSLEEDAPEDFSSLQTVFLLEKDKRLIPFFLEAASIRGEKGFLKFEDVNTYESALAISKQSMYLPKSSRPKSGRGEFYNDEIEGFEVWDNTAGLLGKSTEVMQTGANRLLVVDNNGKEVLIPIDSPLITSINKSKKRINVDLPEGFLDI